MIRKRCKDYIRRDPHSRRATSSGIISRQPPPVLNREAQSCSWRPDRRETSIEASVRARSSDVYRCQTSPVAHGCATPRGGVPRRGASPPFPVSLRRPTRRREDLSFARFSVLAHGPSLKLVGPMPKSSVKNSAPLLCVCLLLRASGPQPPRAPTAPRGRSRRRPR